MPIDLASDSTESMPGAQLDRDLESAAALLRTAARVTVVCHENPDADTLGGGLALAIALEAGGVSAEVVCATGWPSNLAFLPGIDRVRSAAHDDADVVVLVDCASMERAGPTIATWIREGDATVLNVDHHASNGGYGAVACIDPSAAATSEVVARLIRSLGVDPGPAVATLLAAGILHDTDGLRSPTTRPGTLRLVADLVEAGADIADVSRRLYGQRPVNALRLWGSVMACLEEQIDGRLVVGTLWTEDLEASGADLLDAEDLPDMIATADAAEIALLLREVGPEGVRVSIRTGDLVDASSVAEEFGGGGHARAAGCMVKGSVEEARSLLVDACARHLATAGAGR